MKDLVVCIKDFTGNSTSHKGFKTDIVPVKGGIYEILQDWGDMYVLRGFPADFGYASHKFRPVDDTFGPAICETIEQQLELEKVLN